MLSRHDPNLTESSSMLCKPAASHVCLAHRRAVAISLATPRRGHFLHKVIVRSRLLFNRRAGAVA